MKHCSILFSIISTFSHVLFTIIGFTTNSRVLCEKDQSNVDWTADGRCEIKVTNSSTLVNCSRSNFEEIPYESIPLNATELLLDFNRIRSLANCSFQRFVKLNYLSISENRIGRIDSDAFCGLDNLVTLNISNNPLESLSTELFASLTQLQTLSLREISASCDTFNTIFTHPMIELRQLTFSFNNQFKFPFFEKQGIPLMQNLTVLTLRGNSIKKLSSGIFRGIQKIEILDLSKNTITTIGPRDAFID